MCLERVFTDEEMEEWLSDKPEVIEVWKAVYCYPLFTPFCYCSPFRWFGSHQYKSGFNVIEKAYKITAVNGKFYWAGFHCATTHQLAVYFSYYCLTNDIIKCLIKKEWITAIGEQKGKTVIITSQAIFPHYPETEARLEDLPIEEPICETVET